MPWSDLALNCPGRSTADLDDASYRACVAGEQRTAGVLASLERQGFRILHSIPLSPRKDIDHLIIGPTGVFAINTKATTYEVAAKSDGTVYTDGYRQNWTESITRDAGVAAGYLATAARMELDTQPLVAVWFTLTVHTSSPALVAGDDVACLITGVSTCTRKPGWTSCSTSRAARTAGQPTTDVMLSADCQDMGGQT
ncbi:hypothetical protein DBR22_09795 [Arthrobacter sp. HMWF013]|nr:hypothetical protein DBR22_09795 [Arthrobacter sp. HMWF013]